MANGFVSQKCDDNGAPVGTMVRTGVLLSPEDLEQALSRLRILEKHYEWFDELAVRYGQPPPHVAPDGSVYHYGLVGPGELLRWAPVPHGGERESAG